MQPEAGTVFSCSGGNASDDGSGVSEAAAEPAACCLSLGVQPRASTVFSCNIQRERRRQQHARGGGGASHLRLWPRHAANGEHRQQLQRRQS